MRDGTVLVTGGSGYIGGWCVARLLNDGWQVRTTIRNLARELDVRRALATVAPQQDALSFAVADLDRDEGWAEAAKGCRYVLHVASPLGLEAPRDPEVLIRPAREGARRVIHAAIAAGAERVVMTSSVTGPTTSVVAPPLSPISFQAARMSGDFSGSVLAISRLLKGAPGVPNLGFNYVDVRDVADLHLRAMLSPAAAGQRFIASSEFLWYGEVAALLRERPRSSWIGECGRRGRRSSTAREASSNTSWSEQFRMQSCSRAR